MSEIKICYKEYAWRLVDILLMINHFGIYNGIAILLKIIYLQTAI